MLGAALRRHWRLVLVSVVLSTAAGTATALVVEDQPGAPPAPSLDVADVATTFDGRTAAWVQQENERDGTDDWRLDPRRAKGVEGFADAASAVRGDAVSLYVSTPARRFDVAAYRLGYYDGDGGRLVWEADDVRAVRQPAPLVEPRTRMVEADWTPSLTVRINADFVPGLYLFKLVDEDGRQAHIPLVVRGGDADAAFLLLDPATARAAVVGARVSSFDRPVGAADVTRDLVRTIAFVESRGLAVAYAADVDLHRDALRNHRAVVVLGHDGYWSDAMRRALQDDNVLFLGPAPALRRVRFEDSPLGLDRRMVDEGASTTPPLAGPRVMRVVDRLDWPAVAEALAALS